VESAALLPIRLADEADFRLGVMRVRPSRLEVLHRDRRRQVEPRVMQVLVALARSDGEVVSRDELIALCWDGRIVGEDAITRCIVRLRRLADAVPGSFRVHTVPRVGYRIAPDATGAAPQLAAAPGVVQRALSAIDALFRLTRPRRWA
jgi:DNA-binding winged helix-turn-helix (wHTH) protein